MKKVLFILLVILFFFGCDIDPYGPSSVKIEVYGDASEYRIQYGFLEPDGLSYNAKGDLNQNTSTLPWEFCTHNYYAESEYYLIVDNNDPSTGKLTVKILHNSPTNSTYLLEVISSGQRIDHSSTF